MITLDILNFLKTNLIKEAILAEVIKCVSKNINVLYRRLCNKEIKQNKDKKSALELETSANR